MTEELSVRVSARLERAYLDMAAQDLESLMTLYAQDAVIQGPGQEPVQGTAAIRTFWMTTFAAVEVRLAPTVDEVVGSGGLVFVRGRADGVMAPRDGSGPTAANVWFHQLYVQAPDGGLLFWRGANGPRQPTAH